MNWLLRYLGVFVILFLLTDLLVGEKALSGTNMDNRTQDKFEVGAKVASDCISIGIKLYERNAYEQAEKHLLLAVDHQEYLTPPELNKLNEYLEKSHKAAIEKRRIISHIEIGDKLTQQGKVAEARAHFEMARNSEMLTGLEEKSIERRIKQISEERDGRRQASVLYIQGIELYRKSRLQEAKKSFQDAIDRGFLTKEETKDAEEYLIKIQGLLNISKIKDKTKIAESFKKTDLSTIPITKDSDTIKVKEQTGSASSKSEKVISVAQPDSQKSKQEVDEKSLSRKENILRGYARAIVKDSVLKTRDSIKKDKYYQAEALLKLTEGALNKYREQLGEGLFEQYKNEVNQMKKEIAKGRSRWLEGG